MAKSGEDEGEEDEQGRTGRKRTGTRKVIKSELQG
jgi:hypothetical protein